MRVSGDNDPKSSVRFRIVQHRYTVKLTLSQLKHYSSIMHICTCMVALSLIGALEFSYYNKQSFFMSCFF